MKQIYSFLLFILTAGLRKHQLDITTMPQEVVTPWKLNYTILLRIILYKIMQDCTWLSDIDKFYENDDSVLDMSENPVLIPTTTVLQLHNDAATIQMKEIVTTENTLYHNLYLAASQWFQMLISLLQLTEKWH
jgi:hypothetical protein